jgi:PTS system nitrogen regulatory IIA component
MKISDFLAPSRVQIDLRVSDKTKLIRELAQRAAGAAGLSADAIVAALAQREALGSTGLGGGVAIPHARFAELKQPFGMVARLRKAIAFDAIDGQPVDVVFALLLPREQTSQQLNALANVARALRDPVTIRKVRSAARGAEIYAALAQ